MNRRSTWLVVVAAVFTMSSCSSEEKTLHRSEDGADEYIVRLDPKEFLPKESRTKDEVKRVANNLIKQAREATLRSGYTPEGEIHGNVNAENFDRIIHVYHKIFPGFSARLSPPAVLELEANSIVRAIDENRKGRIN